MAARTDDEMPLREHTFKTDRTLWVKATPNQAEKAAGLKHRERLANFEARAAQTLLECGSDDKPAA